MADSFGIGLTGSKPESSAARFSSSSSSLEGLMNGPTTWNSVVGEADRAFRRGTEMEKSGQYRAANGAFHEAATL